jgi:hypothetical protein
MKIGPSVVELSDGTTVVCDLAAESFAEVHTADRLTAVEELPA